MKTTPFLSLRALMLVIAALLAAGCAQAPLKPAVRSVPADAAVLAVSGPGFTADDVSIVAIDGAPVGFTPGFTGQDIELLPGPHTLELEIRDPFMATQTRTVEFTARAGRIYTLDKTFDQGEWSVSVVDSTPEDVVVRRHRTNAPRIIAYPTTGSAEEAAVSSGAGTMESAPGAEQTAAASHAATAGRAGCAEEIQRLKAKIGDLVIRNDELRARIRELEAQP